MITSREFHSTDLAMATAWRWPPESEATGWRIERTDVTDRLASVSRAGQLHGLLVEQDVAGALAAQEQVLDDVEVVAQGQVLVHGLDAERGRVAGVRMWTGLPSQQDLPAVGGVDAADALDEHRLAGAVVAGQGGDLPGRHDQVDVGQGLHRAEVLVQAAQLEQWRRPSGSSAAVLTVAPSPCGRGPDGLGPHPHARRMRPDRP